MWYNVLKAVLGTALGVCVAGCDPSRPEPVATREQNPPMSSALNGNVVGLNIKRLDDGDPFSPLPIPNHYYGQLIVEPTLSSRSFTGPSARNLLSYAFQIFGQEVREFGVSVTPIINGTELPVIVPFSYKYNSQSSSWESTVVERYYSPLVRLSGNTTLEYRFSFVSARDQSVPLAQKVAELTKHAAGLAGNNWVFSALSKPLVEKATERTDDIISLLLSQTVQSTVTGALRPASNGEREKNYALIGNDGLAIAEISMQALLTSTIEGAQVIKPGQTFHDSVPKVDPFTDPRTTIWIDSERRTTLSDHLTRRGAPRLDATDPEAFTKSCEEIISLVQRDIGLNIFDTINVMRWILLSSNFSTSRNIFESSCLPPQYKELMERMGIPITLAQEQGPEPIRWSTVTTAFDAIGSFSRNPSNDHQRKPDIEAVLSDPIILVDNSGLFASKTADNGVSVSRDMFINTLAKLETARYCCYRRPWIDGSPDNTSLEMPFRQRNKTEIFFLRMIRNDNRARFQSVVIYPAKEEQLSANEAGELRKKWSSEPSEL